MRTKLDHPVMHNGEVTTIAELDSRGLIHWRMSDKFHSQRGTGIRVAYFADIKGTTSGWEVSKYAYDGRVSRFVAEKLEHSCSTTEEGRMLEPCDACGQERTL